MTRHLITAAALLAAGAAAADCPVSMADSANGIYVGFDGYVIRYDRRPDGVVEELEFDTADGGGFRYVSQHGIFILESSEMAFGQVDAATSEVITYEVPLPTVVTPNTGYDSNTVVTHAGEAPFDEALSVTFGAERMENIGSCSLSVIPVEMRTGLPGNQHISNFSYFPALGFGVFVSGAEEGQPLDFYTPRSISTEPPASPGTSPAPAPAPASPAPQPGSK